MLVLNGSIMFPPIISRFPIYLFLGLLSPGEPALCRRLGLPEVCLRLLSEFWEFVKLKSQEKNNGGCENYLFFSRCPTKMSGLTQWRYRFFSLLKLKITGIEARTLGISSRWEWVNISGLKGRSSIQFWGYKSSANRDCVGGMCHYKVQGRQMNQMNWSALVWTSDSFYIYEVPICVALWVTCQHGNWEGLCKLSQHNRSTWQGNLSQGSNTPWFINLSSRSTPPNV